jgi:hypothetical protein
MQRKTITLIIMWMFISVIAALSTEKSDPSHWGQRKTPSFNDLHQNFDQPDMIYAPFAFWFWDAPLDKFLIADMSREMCRQRMYPGYVHARWGMPREHWLSQFWFESFDSALKEAEAANAYLGYVDEYGWPCDRDIRLWMPLLIDEDVEGFWAKARWDWFDVVSDIYADSFLSSISRWLEENDMYCISNLWEENLLSQTIQVGDFFKGQRVFSFPGNDCLLLRGLKVHDFKETQSVTEFEGRRFMTEMMGVAGWQMSPVTMKKVLNSVIAWGVSHVVPHGVYLNRELNTIPFPPDWFTSNPYWRYFHLWTDFARRASYVNSHGYVVPDVLLLNPMDYIWGLVGGDIFDFNSKIIRIGQSGRSSQVTGHGKTVDQIDEIYSKAITDLSAARIEYLVADRYYFRQMSISPDGLLVRKSLEFKAVILPQMIIMPLDVAEKVVAFAEAGGYVYLLGDLPEGSTDNGLKDPKMKALMDRLQELPSVRKAPGGVWQLVAEKAPFMKSQAVFESGRFPMVQLHRCIDNRDFFWLVNNTGSRQECTLAIQDVKGLASIWDCETGSKTNIPSQPIASGSRVKLAFKPHEAYWLVFDPQNKPIQSDIQPREFWLTIAALYAPWNIRIDRSVQPPPAVV